MRNFDQDRAERARIMAAAPDAFRIHGEDFHLRAAVRPEVIAQLDQVDLEKPSDVIAKVDDVVTSILVPADAERWRAVRADDDDPITLQDLMGVMQFVVEAATGRPTTPPVDSLPGPAPTGGFSTVGLDSTAPTLPALMPDD